MSCREEQKKNEHTQDFFFCDNKNNINFPIIWCLNMIWGDKKEKFVTFPFKNFTFHRNPFLAMYFFFFTWVAWRTSNAFLSLSIKLYQLTVFFFLFKISLFTYELCTTSGTNQPCDADRIVFINNSKNSCDVWILLKGFCVLRKITDRINFTVWLFHPNLIRSTTFHLSTYT